MMTGTAEQIAVWLMRNGKEGKLYDIKEHSEKRSLSQNAYYWKMLSILAKKLRISNARLHNTLLRDCAEPFYIGGKVAMQPIPDTDEAENDVLEAETYHLKPTSGIITGADGGIYRWYIVLRGSSTFCVEEMSNLLNRLLEECRQQGIQTLTQDEIERMRMYELDKERKKEKEDNGMCNNASGTEGS